MHQLSVFSEEYGLTFALQLPSLCVICVCRWDFGEIPGLTGDKSAYIRCLSLVTLPLDLILLCES